MFVVLVGCVDVIDVQPENDTTFTNFFKTTKDAENLLTTLQMDIQNMMCQTTERNPHILAGEIIDSTGAPYTKIRGYCFGVLIPIVRGKVITV